LVVDVYTIIKVEQTDSGVVVSGDTLRMTNLSHTKNHKYMQVVKGEDSGMIVNIIEGVVYTHCLISKSEFVARDRTRNLSSLAHNL